jgi:NodT family efflux transporter outer membrane factor (OMF) lipoprotein
MRNPFPLQLPSTLALALLSLLAASPVDAARFATIGDSQVAIPAQFAAGSDAGTQAAAWSALGDPTLDLLLAEAMAANTDVRAAVARLASARAEYGFARADAWSQGETELVRSGGSDVDSTWSAGSSTRWEIDLFGRKARGRDAARARGEGRAAELEAARLAVAADVARSWFQLRGAREVVALRERALRDQTAIVALTQTLVDEGFTAHSELARSGAEAASDEAELLHARDTLVALEARLAVLVGATPGAWRAPPSAALASLQLRPLALSAPARLLRERPDVRAAERALAACGADARAAAAARFPTLTLTGALGFLSGNLGGLFSSSNDAREHAATLAWSPSALPRLQARYRQAQAASSAALAAYDAAVLAALEDVEVALQRHGSASERARLRLRAAEESRIAAAASLARYEEGAAPYLDALSARRDAVRSESAAIEALVAQRSAVIDVLRAFGTTPGDGNAVASR